MPDNTAMFTFLGTMITGISAVIVLIINQHFEYKKAALARQFVEMDSRKKDEALSGIHTLVNSQLTAAMAKISELSQEVIELQQTIRDLVHTPSSSDVNLNAMMKLDNSISKEIAKPVATSVPVVLEAEVKIGELETHESGDVKLKKVDHPKEK